MRSLSPGDPERIGDYRLLGRLGEGGMGCVYLAQSPRGRTVAVKLIRPDLAAHDEFRSRFEQEVEAARRVGGEWTAPVLDADTEAEQPWVATGYLPGISLYEAVAGRKEPLPERTLRILANRLALALGAVHGAGLVHRDVKPSNILVTIDGPRVIDFGIARALETVAGAHLTRTGAVVGSPGFMSPEQVRGERLTAASDVFSLGSVLAYAALRRTPFGGADTAGHVLMYRIAQEEPDIEGVPEGLYELVADCLAKDADARPSTARILERTADPEGEPGPGSTGTEAAEPWLPGGLVAQLGRHAARLLDAEVPGAQAAADRAAGAPAVPPPPSVPPSAGLPPAPSTPPRPSTPPETPPETPPAPLPEELEPDPEPEPAAEAAGVHGMTTVTGPDRARPEAPRTYESHSGPEGSGGRRRTGRALALTAGGLALAVLTGIGTFLALGALDDGGDGGGGKEKKPEARESASADREKPEKGGAKPSSEPSAGKDPSPAPGDGLPKEYLGHWQSTRGAGDEDSERRFEISQGDEGEVVARVYSIGESIMCSGDVVLVSFDGRMNVKSQNTRAYPKSRRCVPLGEQSLKLNDDGTLTWRSGKDDATAELYRQPGGPGQALPASLARGSWEPKEGNVLKDEYDASELFFTQGPVGTATVTEKGNAQCAWEGRLGAARGKNLTFSAPEKSKEAPGKKCQKESKSSLGVRVLSDDEIVVTYLNGGKPVTYKPAD